MEDKILLSLLDRPLFPQAVTQGDCKLLDLGSPRIVKDGAVQAIVPNYPERDAGDRITVWFKQGDKIVLRRYLYLPSSASQRSGYDVFFQPLRSLPSDKYEASYMVTSRTGNSSLSKIQEIKVLNTPPAIAMPIRHGSFWGKYAPGLLDSWVVPVSYTLDLEQELLLHSLGKSTESVNLGIYRNSDDQPFASLKCHADGETWNSSGPAKTQLKKGDLVTVKLEGNRDSLVYLAFTM